MSNLHFATYCDNEVDRFHETNEFKPPILDIDRAYIIHFLS